MYLYIPDTGTCYLNYEHSLVGQDKRTAIICRLLCCCRYLCPRPDDIQHPAHHSPNPNPDTKFHAVCTIVVDLPRIPHGGYSSLVEYCSNLVQNQVLVYYDDCFVLVRCRRAHAYSRASSTACSRSYSMQTIAAKQQYVRSLLGVYVVANVARCLSKQKRAPRSVRVVPVQRMHPYLSTLPG